MANNLNADTHEVTYKELLYKSSATDSVCLMKPREYQQALIDFAKKKNAIIHLGTGLGKTLISIYVIKNLFGEDPSVNKISGSHTTKRKAMDTPKVFFVVKTRNLIKQQAKAIDKLTDLRIGKYDADSDISYMNYARWRIELRRRDVFVIIDKILLGLLRHGIMRIEEISLLIFDECHHASGQSDYLLIMKEFYYQGHTKRPQVLGLTASPIKTTYGKILSEEQVMQELKSFDIELQKELMKLEVKRKVEIIEYNEEANSGSFTYSVVVTKKIAGAFIEEMNLKAVEKKSLKEQYVKYIDSVFSINPLHSKRSKNLELKGKYFKPNEGKLIGLLNTIIQQSAKITKELGLQGIYEYYLFCKHKMNEDSTLPSRLPQILCNAAEKLIKPLLTSAKKITDKYSQKLISLFNFLANYFKDNKASAIIFVNERIIAHLLHRVLIAGKEECKEDLEASLIIGYSMNYNSDYPILREISTTIMEPTQQIIAIEKFRTQESQVLVATDVVEEGMDIPSCNLVCCFNPIKNVKSFIQMQGRARDKQSRFTILSSKERSTMIRNQVNEFKNIVEMERKLSLYVNQGIEPDIDAYKSFEMPKDEYIENADTGAKVYLYNAKVFLAKYCQSLYYDEFCNPSITFSYEETKHGLFIATAVLPPTVVKEVRYYKGTKEYLTKSAAADGVSFEIIKKLIELKKLNRYLLSTSKYGSDVLLKGKITGPEMSTEVMHKYIAVPLLNETRILSSSEAIKEYLYELKITPQFPYLNQENSLGFLFFKGDIETSNLEIIINNEKVFEMLSSINDCRALLNKSLYKNALSDCDRYYAERIKFIQVTTCISKSTAIQLTYEEMMKVKCFHYYSLYEMYNADFAFFQRICSGKDDFTLSLFHNELKELKNHLTKRDANFIMSETPSKELKQHLCFVPILKDNIDYKLIDEVILHIKKRLKLGKIEKFGKLSMYELKGKVVNTVHNKGRYVVFGNSDDNLKSMMLWKDNIKKKSWKLQYWSYYKMRYNIELNIAGNLVKAKSIDSASEKRIMQNINCYNHNKFNELRSEEEKEKYLKKVISEYRKDKHNIYLDIPLELCEVNPLPIELYAILRNTSLILSSFNAMTAFKQCKEEFFKSILVSTNLDNKLHKPSTTVPLSNPLKLHLLSEALTSGSAKEGYSYQRLEFLGDSVLRMLEAWEAFMSTLNSDIGELSMNKVIKLENKRLAQIGYKLGLDKLLRVFPSKGSLLGYVPPGFEDIKEYLNIVDTKKNIAANSFAFKRARENKEFLSTSLNENSLKEEEDSASDLETPDETIGLIKDSLKEKEKKEPTYEETKEDPNFDIEKELEELTKKKQHVQITDKMVADTVESITGAITLSCGLNAAQQWLHYINLIEFNDPPPINTNTSINFSNLEHKLNYKFKDTQLLLQAFTHTSYFASDRSKPYWERGEKSLTENYQKLEYLGGGVIDYMISKYLYSKYTYADPCLLHKLKICCLNNQLFCVIAVDLGLDEYMQASKKLIAELKNYKCCLMSLRYSIVSNDKPIDLDELDHCFIKVLSDVLEAVIGEVMYEVQDFDEVEKIFLPIFIPYFDVYATPTTFTEHPKVLLYEMVDKEKGDLKRIKSKKISKEDREGFNLMVYKGWLGDILVAQGKFRYDNCIIEKKFFKKMLKNVGGIIKEYHKRMSLFKFCRCGIRVWRVLFVNKYDNDRFRN